MHDEMQIFNAKYLHIPFFLRIFAIRKQTLKLI
jgi:hypothetical protein